MSDGVERLSRITALAERVWGDGDLAREFLSSAQPQLGNARPVDLARSDSGALRVEKLLLGIEHSLPV